MFFENIFGHSTQYTNNTFHFNYCLIKYSQRTPHHSFIHSLLAKKLDVFFCCWSIPTFQRGETHILLFSLVFASSWERMGEWVSGGGDREWFLIILNNNHIRVLAIFLAIWSVSHEHAPPFHGRFSVCPSSFNSCSCSVRSMWSLAITLTLGVSW